MTADLRLGDWREALADVAEVDAVITDPPYGGRTHDGDIAAAVQQMSATGQPVRRPLNYAAWTPEDVAEFVGSWAPRCRGWMVAMTSHDLIPAWEEAYTAAGLYSFAPLVWIHKRPRLLGDGPACWAVFVMVARPRNKEFARWGCLPGAYLPGPHEKMPRVGGKPLWLMQALVRDYSRPGDLVCDPCAGAGTTLLAARAEDRSAVGSEVDPEAHAVAAARLAKPFTPNLFQEAIR